MKKVSLDSCVFFSMIRYSNILKQYGMAYFNSQLLSEEEHLKKMKKEIKSYMTKDFLDNNKNVPFDQLLYKYKLYEADTIASCDHIIKTKKLQLKDPSFPKRKALILQQEIDDAIKLRKHITDNYDRFKKDRQDYRNADTVFKAGKLLQLRLNGKIDFYIVPSVYEEIKQHTADFSSNNNPEFITYTKEQVQSISKLCTLISIKDHNITEIVRHLSSRYRNQIEGVENATPMKHDKNSLQKYGDSLIMAESNLAGLPLVTDNHRDFIENVEIRETNDFIRQHILLVSKRNKPITTDSPPISIKECLDEKYAMRIYESGMLKLTDANENSTWATLFLSKEQLEFAKKHMFLTFSNPDVKFAELPTEDTGAKKAKGKTKSKQKPNNGGNKNHGRKGKKDQKPKPYTRDHTNYKNYEYDLDEEFYDEDDYCDEDDDYDEDDCNEDQEYEENYDDEIENNDD